LIKTSNDKIEALWIPPSPIKLIEIHEFILKDAKQLMRQGIQNGFSLKPYDAIHLATAKRMKIDEIHTYEPAWFKYAQFVGHKITLPRTERLPFPPTDEKQKLT